MRCQDSRSLSVTTNIHRDYASPTTIQIRVYDDRIAIWNAVQLPPEWTADPACRGTFVEAVQPANRLCLLPSWNDRSLGTGHPADRGHVPGGWQPHTRVEAGIEWRWFVVKVPVLRRVPGKPIPQEAAPLPRKLPGKPGSLELKPGTTQSRSQTGVGPAGCKSKCRPKIKLGRKLGRKRRKPGRKLGRKPGRKS